MTMLSNETVRKLHEMRLGVMAEAFSAQLEDMFRGDPRKPWIDISSEKITQRHLGMVALQTYLLV